MASRTPNDTPHRAEGALAAQRVAARSYPKTPEKRLFGFLLVHLGISSYMAASTPDGAGPFPAVMMISGCSGFMFGGGGFYNGIQNRITKLGFLVIGVDSLRFRGQDRCDGGGVSVNEQVADIQAAAAYLRGRDNVRKEAINVLGWSWGGG